MSWRSIISLLRRQPPVTATSETQSSMVEVSTTVVTTGSVTVENLTNLMDSTLTNVAKKVLITSKLVKEDMVWKLSCE